MTGTLAPPSIINLKGRSTMRRILSLGLALAALTSPVAAFEVSSSYLPAADLVPGHYACVSGLDFHSHTWTFQLNERGGYIVDGLDGAGSMAVAPNGEITIETGPFASDDTATTYAMNTMRVSDRQAVVIIRYDFGDTVTDDYCARFQ